MTKQHAPATLRNREPLAQVLGPHLGPGARVLELASGSGEHGVWFCGRFAGIHWQPSDVDSTALASIRAWAAEADAPGLADPIALDVTQPDALPEDLRGQASLVFTANLLHISAPETTAGVMRVAAQALGPGGHLAIYGPIKQGGAHTAPSNAQFEAWLTSLDPRYGVRDQEAIDAAAGAAGLEVLALSAMPANNVVLWYRKPGG